VGKAKTDEVTSKKGKTGRKSKRKVGKIDHGS
jgi:hypothetical protein